MAQAAPAQVQETGPIDVELSQLEPAKVTTAMKIAASLRNQPNYEEHFEGEDGRVTIDGRSFGGRGEGVMIRAVSHKRSRQVRLYKPYPQCVVATIPGENFAAALEDGWTTECPECGTDCKGSPWGCGKTPEPKFYACEVCGRKFWQMLPIATEPVRDEDPNRLSNPFRQTDESDADIRHGMKAQADYLRHMWAYHPDMAASMELPKGEAA